MSLWDYKGGRMFIFVLIRSRRGIIRGQALRQPQLHEESLLPSLPTQSLLPQGQAPPRAASYLNHLAESAPVDQVLDSNRDSNYLPALPAYCFVGSNASTVL